MSGLLLLLALVLWIGVATWASITVTSRLSATPWRLPVGALVVLVLLPLPLADEIVGGHQFAKLCRANSTIQVEPAAAGKTVFLAQSQDVEVHGTWVRVVRKPWRFVDFTTGETVVSYNTLTAVGGWLYRGLTEGGVPLLFKGFCSPENVPASVETFAKFGINYIEPPNASGAGARRP